ncbi:MAG: four helix bundle protein [Bacteroidales bacterium]|jgi:four helix bundle protein|nr:four helix bundle protein [Bacteroidales bacterium]MCK9447594.1 four helix bundle protein [Bacteroidales bacterium]MDD3701489.1 four helix bundle protein [Bacteroidales bacterium]MDY0369216.1 four helix bundle protein [Bacteroidales bacterium]
MSDQTNRQQVFFRFENLRIYHKALEYALWVKENTSLLRSQDCQFADNFCQTSQRISTHIAEGSAREKPLFIQHLKESKSAIRVCLVFTTLAHRLEMITDEQESESRIQLMEMTKMLGALITSLLKNPTPVQEQYDEDYLPTQSW